MNIQMKNILFCALAALLGAVFFSTGALCAESSVTSSTVQLETSGAGPRTVEEMTERTIARDYAAAWKNMAQAFAQGSAGPLSSYFTGTAKTLLSEAVKSQNRSGLHSQYANQSHKLKATFYAPEGDAMELQDTAEFDLQVMDGGKLIHQEHVVLHYIVLMTPSADRWMVRRLEAVPGASEKEVSSERP